MAVEIRSIKIHPAIGVARLGDHPTAFFDGPQKPFESKVPSGGYKKDGKIKRQAAVFRLFGYDANGKVVKEITSADADIRWQVELANKKAFGHKFAGLNSNTPLRNPNVAPAQRHRLSIQPTVKTVDNSNKEAKLDDGKFTSWNENGSSPKEFARILLGELEMNSQGFLRVLGGKGTSKTGHPEIKINNYANNNSWFDDVADGPVNATVTLKSNDKIFEAETAWVICAPPSFAPQIRSIVTFYDVLMNRAVDRGLLALPDEPSFAFDVYPTLAASLHVKFVHDIGSAHGTLPPLLKHDSPMAIRQFLLSRIRLPNGTSTNNRTMPRLLGDNGGPALALTKLQYHCLEKWALGNVKTNDEHEGPPAVPDKITPDGMDRAALESCVGGGLFPGIEAGWFLRQKYDLVDGDFFRLSLTQNNQQCPVLKAGDITKQMALPWQADFTQCRRETHGGIDWGWWPAVRPDDVLVGTSATSPTLWAGTVDDDSISISDQYVEMMKQWKKLGFVVKSGNKFVVK